MPCISEKNGEVRTIEEQEALENDDNTFLQCKEQA